MLSSMPISTTIPLPQRKNQSSYFSINGKQALKNILLSLHLDRDDVVTILTTTNEVYVSSCVSLTCFNICTISRKIQDKTRVVIIIHEHGYIYPDTDILCENLQSKGIITIEDCAHIAGTPDSNSAPVGSYGDYAIFSLPKIFPLSHGGLALTDRSIPNFKSGTDEDNLKRNIILPFEQALPYSQAINNARQQNHALAKSAFGKGRIEYPSEVYIPYFTRLKIKEHGQFSTGDIEFGATLRNDLLLIPTNPLVPHETYIKSLTALQTRIMHDENQPDRTRTHQH